MENNNQIRFCRPPICPKPEKATTITIHSHYLSPSSHLKNNQRLTHQPTRKDSVSPVPCDSVQPFTSGSTFDCFQNKREKANVLHTEYQQYSRKNFLKTHRDNNSSDANIVSHLTEKVIGNRS